jgi:predicted nucleic acid-binding protein
VDSNVVLKWVLIEADTPKARQLRADFQSGVHELIAPDVLPSEVAHALTRAERKGVLAVGQTEALLLNVLTTPPALHPYLPLLQRAVRLSSQTRSALTDCLFVALAEREGCELVTADGRLVGNLSGRFPFVKALAALP